MSLETAWNEWRRQERPFGEAAEASVFRAGYFSGMKDAARTAVNHDHEPVESQDEFLTSLPEASNA